MNKWQYKIIKKRKGFIAALDQSGGSSGKTLENYGVLNYNSEEEMFNEIHKMRTRIILSPSFTSEHIIGTILFGHTMNNMIDDMYTADYLWQIKGIVPFLKIDKGLEEESNGVQLMKPIPNLEEILVKAVNMHIFGTKMRSVIKDYNEEGIKTLVKQQFELAEVIFNHGLIPIIEPEVDINCIQKGACEELLKNEIRTYLSKMNKKMKIMFKFTIPSIDDFYLEFTKNHNVLRVVFLSGGYSLEKSNLLLKRNKFVVASFSRALLGGLNISQTDTEFDMALYKNILSIYDASIKKD